MGISAAIFATLGMVTFGLVVAGLGLLLLKEYRGAFFQDPRAVMTLEVFTRAGGVMGPGYLSMLLLLLGAVFIVMGLAGTVTLVGFYVLNVLGLVGR